MHTRPTLLRSATFIIALLLLLQAPSAASQARYEATFFDVFDTFSRVIVYADSEAEAEKWLQLAHDELLAYHQLYDIYNEYQGITNLCAINRLAANAPVPADRRVLALLSFSQEMYDLTSGRVNVAMGAVLRLWHDAREQAFAAPAQAAPPDMSALRDAAAHCDIRSLRLDFENGTVSFNDPLLKLDVGAVAKGYAVERVAQALMERGVSSALLDVGGNVRAIGLRGDGTAYRAAIQNPDLSAPEQTLMAFALTDASLVTSGGYHRFLVADGTAYHHIIDPDTLQPARRFRSVSILTEDSGLADALSTALFILPLKEGQALLSTLAHVEALWVLPDGRMVATPGMS